MRRLLKWFLVLCVLAGGVALAGLWLKPWLEQRSKPKFLTATVSRGRVATVVTSTGTVKPMQSVSVGAFTSGPIARVFVDFNDHVTKGQILAKIAPQLLSAAVERDEAVVESQYADLDRATALLKQAENNEKRARNLRAVNKDYLSDSELDQYHFNRMSLEAQVKLGKATIRQVEANLKNSRANLGYTDIISPVDGIVIERKVDEGQTVASSFATPELFIIAPNMDEFMFVFASVDEADIGQINAAKDRGEKAQFTVDAYPGDLFEGEIHQIRKNSTTTQNVVTYPVVIKVPNPKLKLLPGMTANITFQIEGKESVLRVPAGALRFTPLPAQVHPEDRHHVEAPPPIPSGDGGKKSAGEKADQSRKRQHRLVWVKDGDLLRAVPVTLGLMETRFAELVEGDLTEGQELVIGTESAIGQR